MYWLRVRECQENKRGGGVTITFNFDDVYQYWLLVLMVCNATLLVIRYANVSPSSKKSA